MSDSPSSTSSSSASKQSFFQDFFLRFWYPESQDQSFLFTCIQYCLYPLACLLQIIAKQRAVFLKKKQATLSIPVVVVGNITVGGTGKTPVVIALVKALQEKNIQVGVISRGHGSRAPSYPFTVEPNSHVNDSGDEALLIAQSTHCPVVIDANRISALGFMQKHYPEVQLIISDDGLQHYRLPRSLEIVLLDGERGFGNGLCIPAGPLREPLSRLSSVDWLVVNGELKNNLALKKIDSTKIAKAAITLEPVSWQHLKSQKSVALNPLPWGVTTKVKAIAAIGNPDRFFSTVAKLGIKSENVAFDDHYQFKAEDLAQWHDQPVLMTTKDAVKCQHFAQENWWALGVRASLSEEMVSTVIKLLPN